jgi:HAD superfamily hydrolase (TIGR01549 family)
MIKAILFDFDDTLVMTRRTKGEALKELARIRFDKELTDEDLDRYWGTPYQEFLSKLFGIRPDQIMDHLADYRRLSQKYPQRAYPDTHKTLEQLMPRYFLGIITATSRYALENQMQELHLPMDGFGLLQTADDCEFHKPDPRVFNPALELLGQKGLDRHEILYVGDSLRDWRAAQGAGLHFLGLAGNTTPSQAFRQEGAAVIDSLAELVSYDWSGLKQSPPGALPNAT